MICLQDTNRKCILVRPLRAHSHCLLRLRGDVKMVITDEEWEK